MAVTKDAQDRSAGRKDVPALINDYRALQESMRAQALSLARVREEVLAAADREARGIVAAARSEVRGVLVKARRDLLGMASQLQAAIDAPQQNGSAGDVSLRVGIHVDDPHVGRDVIASARREMRGVLSGVRPDIEALDDEVEAFQTRLLQHEALFPQRAAPAAIEARPAPLKAFPSESRT